MNQFFEAFANMFGIPDLRKRLLFTLAMLAVYRLGAFLPTPGINTDVLAQFFNQNAGSVLGVIDLFSGGNFRRLTIFALGIMPYITASIILQLMTVVWPYLERLQKEGELGRRKITQYTRYLTILLSIVQSFSIAETLQRTGGPGNQPLVYNPGIGFVLMTIPPIFASSLLTFPGTINLVLGKKWRALDWLSTNLAWGEPWYILVYITLIIVFAFFYVGIVFNPTELADNMRKYGGFIPGIRPGRNTSEHIDRVLRRLTFVGGVYLAAVFFLPEWLMSGFHLQHP